MLSESAFPSLSGCWRGGVFVLPLFFVVAVVVAILFVRCRCECGIAIAMC
jgi:hypothetical protein